MRSEIAIFLNIGNKCFTIACFYYPDQRNDWKDMAIELVRNGDFLHDDASVHHSN